MPISSNTESTEILPVVDERDQIITFCNRAEVHRRRLRHRSVHLLLFNHNHAVLLQKRSVWKTVKPGYWDSAAAGHVEGDESYDQCLGREVRKELGVDLITPPRKLIKLKASPETGMEFCQVYAAVHPGPFYPNPREIECLRWFGREEIRSWLGKGGGGLTETLKTIFRLVDYPATFVCG